MKLCIGDCQEGLAINKSDIKFFDASKPPFSVHGLNDFPNTFKRMPESVAKSVSDAVLCHSASSAGGRVRFATDSPYVAIKIKHAEYNCGSPIIARTAYLGVDLYVNEKGKQRFIKNYIPPLDCEDGYEGVIELKEGMKEITLYLPYGKEVKNLSIGVKNDSKVTAHTPYKYSKPVVFYGSSITQGVATSRPGNIYEGMISRMLDCDFLNLGFSGSCLGEEKIAEYISNIDMSVFVLDYDHNAPDAEYLQDTIQMFFNTIRKNHPNLPIVMISRPADTINEVEQSRKDVIMNTYLSARNNGDKNVYYIDGYTFFPDDCKYDCTVDGCHPNDLGMYFISRKISNVLKELL